MDKYELIATTTFGVESIVKQEVKDLGYDIKEVKNGKIVFTGDEKAICRANIWLRSAERVLLKIGEFPATDFDQLYESCKSLPWSEYLPEDASFPVTGKSVKSELHHVPSCQSIVKKAIVDNMQNKYKKKWFDEDGPEYKIEVALLKDEATLTIDTSGWGLHKRGYRDLTTKAPLQETIAAAMIYLSRWDKDRILIDPFCGSGTILISAALLGIKNIYGSDKDKKSIIYTQNNFNWLIRNSNISLNKAKFFRSDVRKISQNTNQKFNLIVTEPYLGPLKIKKQDVDQQINKLSELYLKAFKEFKHILSKKGKIVIIFPVFDFDKRHFLPILKDLNKMGWKQEFDFSTLSNYKNHLSKRNTLLYFRLNQEVLREVLIFHYNK